MPNTLDALNEQAADLAAKREAMNKIVRDLKKGIAALREQNLPRLRQAIEEATQAWSLLEESVRANPELFVRPRKVTFAGITFGMEKSKGTLEVKDPDKTVRLIEKHFPDQIDLLIDTKKTPAKDALTKLPAADLRRIGCELVGTGDRAVIRAAADETDKLIKALIKTSVDEADEGGAE